MSSNRYNLNCRITNIKEKFSGKEHTLIINHDQQEYYFDELFIAILENINSLEKKEQFLKQFTCSQEEFDIAYNLILKGRFVLPENESRSPKIGILTERMSLGFGVDLVVHETAKRLDKDFGYDVTVYTGKVEESYQDVTYNIISLDEELNLGSDTFSQKYHTIAIPYLNSKEIDLWLIETPPFYYWKDQLNAPIIFVEHGTPDGDFFPKKMRLIVESASWVKKHLIFEKLRPYDHIVTVSEYLKSTLPDEARKRTTVIHNGSDHYSNPQPEEIDSFKREYGINKGDFILLSVARIDFDPEKSPYKGLEELLEIYEKVKTENKSIKLILAGRSEDKYKDLLKNKDIIPILNVPAEKLPIIFSACDLYITASKWEGFNLPLAEAQYAGKPCIAYNLCAHPELIKNGETGFLVESKEEFADKILELSTNRDLINAMIEKSFKNSELFKWLDSITKLNDLIVKLYFKKHFNTEYSCKKNKFQFFRMYFQIGRNILKTEGVCGLITILSYEVKKRIKDFFRIYKKRHGR